MRSDIMPLYEKFNQIYGGNIVGLMFNMEPIFDSPYYYPVYNAYGFPSHVHHNLDDVLFDQVNKEVFPKHKLITQDLINGYNTYLRDNSKSVHTNWAFAPNGVCQKGTTPKSCKPGKDRFTCQGCGIVYVPRSLVDKACVVHADPWWYKYAEPFLKPLVEATGGVSKTDPLVLFPHGPRRHGRTQNGRIQTQANGE